MSKTAINLFQTIKESIPFFIRNEFPLFGDLLEQYYISLEKKSGIYDILNKITDYLKVDNIILSTRNTSITRDHYDFETTIEVESTLGFPETNGLIKINDEIIFYKEKNETQFLNCSRGFSGLDSFGKSINFSKTSAQDHSFNSSVINIYSLLLEEFLVHIKKQILPGFEYTDIATNQNVFLKQSVDFYNSKGSEESFRILFSAIFGLPAKIVRPRENVFEPSVSYYNVTTDLLVEPVKGNVQDCLNRTIYQYSENGDLLYGTITSIESTNISGKQYYILSIDFNYDKDIINKGSLYGIFDYSKRTIVLEDTNINSFDQNQSIFVNSTLGFLNADILQIKTPDNEEYDLEYFGKNSNQFFIVQKENIFIPKNSYLTTKNFAFCNIETETVEMRICPIFSNNYSVDGNSISLENKDPVIVSSLGENNLSPKFNEWIFNLKNRVNILSIEVLDDRLNKYKIEFYNEYDFYLNDFFDLFSSDGVSYELKLLTKNNGRTYTFSSNKSILNITTPGFYAVRKISKGIFQEEFSPNIESIANVQNVFTDFDKQNVYVESGSIPYYDSNPTIINSRKITFSGNYSPDTDNYILNIGKHKLLTGDFVVYNEPTTIEEIIDTEDEFSINTINNPNRLNISNGKYYVQVVDNENIKLSVSISKLSDKQYINFNGNPVNNSLYYANRDWLSDGALSEYIRIPESLKISHQKLIKKISPPVNSSKDYETKPGTIGIFKNGTELLNYKSLDQIFYGEIKEISVLSQGSNYDVINPPNLIIDDTSLGVTYGSGSQATLKISGSLKKIEVLNSGVGFYNEPSIKISGGNGSGAIASPIYESTTYSLDFNSSSSISLATNEIIFDQNSYFVSGEVVRYVCGVNTPIGGLINNSSYYVKQSSANKIKLYRTFQDSELNINEINLTSLGNGVHSIISNKKRKLLVDFKILSEGSGYKSTKLIINSPSLINIYDDSLNIKNHNLETGEIILYTSLNSPIGGLSSGQKYYVYKVNNSKIKLCNSEFDLNNRKFIDITSTGQGDHFIEYDPITVSVVNLDNNNNNTLSIRPIFRGSIKSVNVYEFGSNYGTSEILNFNRQPNIYPQTGSNAKIRPVILQGRINSVIIENQGFGYNSIPDIEVFGSGTGAKLIPVITDGRIVDIIIKNPGVGYDKNTFISIISSGTDAKFFADIDKWTVNIVEKEFFRRLVSEDDGFLSKDNYGIKYTYCYTPRKLREYILTKRIESGVERYVPDLSLNPVDNKEADSKYHSPIVGWAYDGNPIYGPYGFSNPDGTGEVRRLKSGYKIVTKFNRPEDQTKFPLGFFVEDYEYFDGEDLDEHNGRFCITPEYPNGVYAYFSTIGEIDPLYKNYRKPQFPYVIGNTYKSDIINFNFDTNNTQDNSSLYDGLIKNTKPYNLFESNSEYEGIDILKEIETHTSSVKTSEKGSADYISIISEGDDYKVNDKIIFDNTSTNYFGINAFVDSIKGREISNITQSLSKIENVEIYDYKFGSVGICSLPHNIEDIGNYIYYIDNVEYNTVFYPNKSKLILVENLPDSSITGITTYINVSGFGDAAPFVFENDIFSLNDEEIKILEVDRKSSRIRIIRQYNGTPGLAHTFGDILEEKSRKLYSNDKILTEVIPRQRQIYFNPKESLGIGTERTILTIENPGIYSNNVAIDPKKIYLKNHFLQTNDVVIYNSNSNFPIRVEKDSVQFSLEENQKLYVYRYSNDFIGLYDEEIFVNEFGEFVDSSRTKIELFTFIDYGSGNYHSFKIIPANSKTTTLNNYILEIQTETEHSLQTKDSIDLNVKSTGETVIKIVYNEENRRFCANPLFFSESSINLEKNSIFIENHGLKNGEKIIHTSSAPADNLINDKIYYVKFIDSDNISLIDSDDNPILIGSKSFGNILPVNPNINIEKNNSIVFDLSDETLSYVRNNVRYSAFDLNLYTDFEYKNSITSTSLTNSFNVKRIGNVGRDLDAKLIFTYDEKVPNTIYYKLDAIKNEDVPNYKYEIFVDDEISSPKINYIDSPYNNTYDIVRVSDIKFKLSLNFTPKNSLFSNYSSSYTTNSLNSLGPVNTIKFTSKGKEFSKIPYIKSINSESGKDFFGILYSSDIGKLKSLDINNINYELLSDKTLQPRGLFPVSLKIEPLSSIERIDIVNFGQNYSQYPDLILIDGLTNEVVTDLDIEINPGTGKVDVLKNTNGIYNVTPTIIPINNTNGYKILALEYDSFSNNVTITLDTVGFSTITAFPFEIGSKFLIENVVTLDPENDLGYNSENYNYKLYTVINSDPNIGGQVPTITFNMRDFSGFRNPGFFDPVYTSARVIPEKFFPTFDIKLKKNTFYEGEQVVSGNFSGTVLYWDKDNEFIKITTRNPQNLILNEILEGKSSSSFGTISNIVGISTVNYNISSLRSLEKGWSDKKGFLNYDHQRIHDSDYYQYFSYAVNSTIDNSNWDNIVKNNNHTSGFKRFSNLSIESNASIDTIEDMSVEGGYLGISNIDNEINLNCIYDYDLVTENSIYINPNKAISDEIRFNSKLLQDYFESSGNRVLIVDDISGEFNSNPRATRFSVADEFGLDEFKFKKYLIYTSNKLFNSDKQSIIVNLLQDGEYGYLNQYARVETTVSHGYFDYTVFNNKGYLQFLPIEYEFTDYNISGLSLNIGNELVGLGTTSWGDVVSLGSTNITIPQGSPSGVPIKILTQSTNYRSSKYIITIESEDSTFVQSNEFNVINTPTDVLYTEFGVLENSNFSPDVSSGFATYYPQLNGSNVDFYIVPNSNPTQNYKVNVVFTNISNTSFIDFGETSLKTGKIFSNYIQIPGSPTTSPGIVTTISPEYESYYILSSIEDTTNNIFEFKELVAIRNDSEVYLTEFGSVISDESLKNSGIGTFSGSIDNITDECYILFEPLANRNVEIRSLIYALELVDLQKPQNTIDLNQSSVSVLYGDYTGTENDIRTSFDLTYRDIPIFERTFNSEDESIVLLEENSILIPNHFFVTGERVNYSYDSSSFISPEVSVGIKTTIISGISTDKLPSEVYIIKVNDSKIQFASSAENALKYNPISLELESVGIGTLHKLTSFNQNVKGLFTIDNMIQSPIQESEVKVELVNNLNATDNLIKLSGISSIFSNDLLKINDEIVLVERVGISSQELIRVRRSWMGTKLNSHAAGSIVTKMYGNYNIVGSRINFASAPYGKIPQSTPQNQLGAPYVRPDDRDFTGITTNSYFSGRVFLRTGEIDSINEVYSDNYLFDNISKDFSGITSEFTLKFNNSSIAGISSNNSIILIKDIFQQPDRPGASAIVGNYKLYEDSGETIIQFNPSTQEVNDDINVTSLPVGGKIVSVGSTRGNGYQPLVSAGGTATISGFGTISQISIGNSGSGYRTGIQTLVNVYAQTSSSLDIVGIASIIDGRVTSVTITNSGTSYTSTNPPQIKFDDPIGYTNIPLIYSNSSSQGIGTGAKIDLIVSRDSSILDYKFINNGYNYREGEILTVDISDSVGIPTDINKSFDNFEITVNKVKNDEFSGWSIGDIQQLDPIDNLFNGIRRVFPIKFQGNRVSIISKNGSNIDVESTLLIFINGILQNPGQSYTFKGGSLIIFSEPPKKEYFSNILFYRGTKDIDVRLVDLIEEIEPGDSATITSTLKNYSQNERQIEEIISADIILTTPYSGPGISDDETFLRPVNICRQTEDLFLNGSLISKDRSFYEPFINPTTNIIQNVSTSSTEIFVENLKTFFDNGLEDLSNKDVSEIELISQENVIVGIATAIVSSAGSITSIDIINPGYGYTFTPQISISNPPEYSLDRISAEISLSVLNGTINSYSIDNSGRGYDPNNPPQVLIEYPKIYNEDFINVNYEGDFGNIVGIANTTVGIGITALQMDFYIDNQSFLKNPSINPNLSNDGSSGISTNYFFVVSNSNIGLGVTSLYVNGDILSSTNLYFDNIFQVYDLEINQKELVGIGTTTIVTIKTLISSLFDLTLPSFDNDILSFDSTNFTFDSNSNEFSYFGNYSWGRIYFDPERSRRVRKEFNSYYINGYSGISTSAIVRRKKRLKSSLQLNYL